MTRGSADKCLVRIWTVRIQTLFRLTAPRSSMVPGPIPTRIFQSLLSEVKSLACLAPMAMAYHVGETKDSCNRRGTSIAMGETVEVRYQSTGNSASYVFMASRFKICEPASRSTAADPTFPDTAGAPPAWVSAVSRWSLCARAVQTSRLDLRHATE